MKILTPAEYLEIRRALRIWGDEWSDQVFCLSKDEFLQPLKELAAIDYSTSKLDRALRWARDHGHEKLAEHLRASFSEFIAFAGKMHEVMTENYDSFPGFVQLKADGRVDEFRRFQSHCDFLECVFGSETLEDLDEIAAEGLPEGCEIAPTIPVDTAHRSTLTPLQRRLLDEMIRHETRATFDELRAAWDDDVSESTIVKTLKRLRDKLPRSQWQFQISQANWEIIWHRKGQAVP